MTGVTGVTGVTGTIGVAIGSAAIITLFPFDIGVGTTALTPQYKILI